MDAGAHGLGRTDDRAQLTPNRTRAGAHVEHGATARARRPHCHPGHPASAIQQGDVIAAEGRTPGTQFAHRVIAVTPASGLLRIRTKGDANPEEDFDPVMLSTSAQVPREIAHVKWIGFPLAFMSSQEGQRLALTLLVGAKVTTLLVFALGRRPNSDSSGYAMEPDEFAEHQPASN